MNGINKLSLRQSMLKLLKSPKVLTYVLGLIGWLIVLQAMPFEWSLPAYAEF